MGVEVGKEGSEKVGGREGKDRVEVREREERGRRWWEAGRRKRIDGIEEWEVVGKRRRWRR